MVTRKTTVVAFIAILITAGLVVFVTQVEAQTTDEQKQALIGEWNGDWGILGTVPATLIIHEIDTANAKARCTYWSSELGKKVPVLADFIPGASPKLEFKLEDNDYKFVLKKKVLEATFRGWPGGGGQRVSKTIKMEKKPEK